MFKVIIHSHDGVLVTVNLVLKRQFPPIYKDWGISFSIVKSKRYGVFTQTVFIQLSNLPICSNLIERRAIETEISYQDCLDSQQYELGVSST